MSSLLLLNYFMKFLAPQGCASLWCRTASNQIDRKNFRPAREIYKSGTESARPRNTGRIHPYPQSFIFLAFSLNCFAPGSGGDVEMNCMSFASFCSALWKARNWKLWKCSLDSQRRCQLWCLGFLGIIDSWARDPNSRLAHLQARSLSEYRTAQSHHIRHTPCPSGRKASPSIWQAAKIYTSTEAAVYSLHLLDSKPGLMASSSYRAMAAPKSDHTV